MVRRYRPDERYIITICHSCKKTINELHLEGGVLKAKCLGCGKIWMFEAKVMI